MMEIPSLMSLPMLWSREFVLSVLLLLASLLWYALWRVLESMWLRPRQIRQKFESQGFTCLPGRFMYGNLFEIAKMVREAHKPPMSEITHNIGPWIMPYYYVWKKRYGTKFIYWHGSQARFILTHPRQAKEVLSSKFGHFVRSVVTKEMNDLARNGLTTLEGEKWAQRRRIMNRAFLPVKLKVIVSTMAACTDTMIERWAEWIAQGHNEIDVHTELRSLSADIIAHTGFGSSYAEGRRVFELQREQQVIVHKAMLKVNIPGMGYIPTAHNRYRWRLTREIDQILMKLIQERLQSAVKMGDGEESYGSDLLGLMLASNRLGDTEATVRGTKKKHVTRMGIRDIIGECKTFFFAGHEATSNVLSWACLLLALNPEWQERAREEVMALCGEGETVLTADVLSQMKIVGMVLSETMRLYPPAPLIMRKANRDVKLARSGSGSGEEEEEEEEEEEGVVMIPAGVGVLVPVLAWHHEAKYWGEDADEFRPDRFDEGGTGRQARAMGAYLPFSMGPRICIGQGFASMEAKLVMASILRRFSFRVSPSYCHSPAIVLTLQPRSGMQLSFHPLP